MAGCDQEADGLPRKPIRGTVTFDGKPVAKGMIQFQPATAAESVSAGSLIEDGTYSIDRAAGLVPGTYKVIINSQAAGAAALPKDEHPGAPRPRPKEPIPAKYNAATTLTIQVKPDEDKSFDFDLKP
jgi:hypothetical protein